MENVRASGQSISSCLSARKESTGITASNASPVKAVKRAPLVRKSTGKKKD